MASFKKLNELYNCLDLYIVASRVEGGPQAIPESIMTETPILSTNVGLASQLLSEDSIFNMDRRVSGGSIAATPTSVSQDMRYGSNRFAALMSDSKASMVSKRSTGVGGAPVARSRRAAS